jgi:hypothetical protein
MANEKNAIATVDKNARNAAGTITESFQWFASAAALT